MFTGCANGNSAQYNLYFYRQKCSQLSVTTIGSQPVLEYFYEVKNLLGTTCTNYDSSCIVSGEENFQSTSLGFTNKDINKCSIKFNFKDVTL